MPKKLNKTTHKYQFMTGTQADLTDRNNAYGVLAEPLYLTDTEQLYVHNGTEYLPVVRASSDVPSSASATGTAGQLAYDSDYIYVCIAEDSWKRVGISSW